MDLHTEPFDFTLYPFALGDTLTWCVRSAIRAIAAGRQKMEILICLDPQEPHCIFQQQPNERQYQLVFSEVFPAFYTHPLLSSLTVFHDRTAFDAALEERVRTGSLPAEQWGKYRAAYAARHDFEAVSRYFAETLSEQTAINAFYERHRSIPWLREVAGCQADVENLIQAQGPGARIVTIQFRLRGLDRAIVADDFTRDAAYFTWERFLDEARTRHPEVRFMLLGRLQEKPLQLLQLPNVVAPRLLGLGLGHELSLLMRSHLYFGSSSGFAQGAHFCQTPYRIFNVNPSACNTYGIPFEADRLPFALPNQRLVYGTETTDQLLAQLDEALTEVAAAEKSNTRQRTERKQLAEVRAEDATTHRFLPDSHQAKYEFSLLTLSSLARIKHNLKRGDKRDAITEINQLHYTLSQVSDQYSPAMRATGGPVSDELARYDAPSLREWFRYWILRIFRQPYFKLLRLPGPDVDFAAYTADNSHTPAAWEVNGKIVPKKSTPTRGWRFMKDQPNAYLKTKPFQMKGTALRLVFEARRPQAAPKRSQIYIFENGRYRVIATPLYTPFWQTYSFDFKAQPQTQLNVQFDNDFVHHWLHVRNVHVGDITSLPPAKSA